MAGEMEFRATVRLERDRDTGVLVRFHEETVEVELLDDRGATMLRTGVDESVDVENGTFYWQGRDLRPHEDDYGLAVAFAHFVNRTLDRTNPESILTEPIADGPRYQYAVVNVGMFRSPERMGRVLAYAGEHGWRLIGVYDKSSNWMNGMEKGFMLLMRPVRADANPREWCLVLRG